MMNEKIWKDFWPTPREVFDEMFSIVDWASVSTVLEPSAGKGNLIRFLREKWELRETYRRPKIDAIEYNPELRQTLQEMNVDICGFDFLKFTSFAPYDLIFANPPFSTGEAHLRHAIELVESWGGGQIVFLLNTETLRNPYSAGRQALAIQLQKYNAKIVDMGPVFADAERSTDVHISLIYINIPKMLNDSLLFEHYKENHMEFESCETPEEMVKRGSLEAICQMYAHEVRLGLDFINEYYAICPYLTDGKTPYFNLFHEERKGVDHRRSFVEKVRLKYWRRFFTNDELASQLTCNLRSEYMSRVNNEYIRYDFTVENVAIAHLEMARNLIEGIEQTIYKLFDDFTREYAWYPESRHNIHYFNGWRTNDCYQVGPKVIFPLSGWRDVDFSWGGYKPSHHSIVERIADIEKSLAYLDGQTKVSMDEIQQILKEAEMAGQTKNIQFKYFSLTFYKKGTCHLRFHDMNILKRFNVFAARGKGWLPPSYGKSTYSEMSKDEQAVVDSFEGQVAYNETMRRPAQILIDFEPANFARLLPGNIAM